MANVATTSKGEIVSVTEADQFSPGKSQYECGFYGCAMARTMSRPGEPATMSAASVINDAESWYKQYDGSNDASNTAGMNDEQEYQLLEQIGLHYQALDLDMSQIRAWLSWGYPVLLAVTEASVHDLVLDGANPYPWNPTGNHIILATGLGNGNIILARDSANCTNVNDPNSLRPGPRMYDSSKLSLISATVVVPPWRPRPASATAIPNADMQIPNGWTDDGEKLTAPNGISVVLGFRSHILKTRWNPTDVPLAPERGADPVEIGDPQSGSGTRLITLYSELAYTKEKGVYNATVGREFWTALQMSQKLPSTPLPSVLSKSAGGGEAPEEQATTLDSELKQELLAAVRLVKETTAQIMARIARL